MKLITQEGIDKAEGEQWATAKTERGRTVKALAQTLKEPRFLRQGYIGSRLLLANRE